MRRLALATVLCAFFSAHAPAVQINELRIDQPGSDDDEYFELFGLPGTSLDGISYVVLGDGASAAGSGVVEFALDLTGQSIGASGYFLVAEDIDTFAAAADLEVNLNFENSDNFTHLLVSGFNGANADDLDGDDNGVLDVLPWAGIVDGFVLAQDVSVPPVGTEFHYAGQLGLPVIGPDGSDVPGYIFRLPDGGAFQMGPFDPFGGRDTPGAANVPEPATLCIAAFALAAAWAFGSALHRLGPAAEREDRSILFPVCESA
jgi:hypothetical protein